MKQRHSSVSPLIIAHRGAQSHFPEHTIEGYQKAIEFGADYIEPDLVLTKDGVFVARHEPYLSQKTNISNFKEFQNRKTTKILDGEIVTDWFVSDFTVAELKKIKTRQFWKNRPHNYDDQFEIPTFEEIIALLKAYKKKSGKEIGIYPELKHPTFHKQLGLEMEDRFLNQLLKAEYTRRDSKIYVQCFEVKTLQYLRRKTSVKLVQLIGASGYNQNGDLRFKKLDGSYDSSGQPYDFYVENDKRDYSFFATPKGMEFMATYADGVGPWKPFVVSVARDLVAHPKSLIATDFVELAHKSKLEVHPYTFKNEDQQWSSNEEPTQEYLKFFEAGVDGVFTDYTNEAVRARNEFLKLNTRS
ncbi:glycerophosphodiester phosphodiesterase [Dokdonia sp. Hel_I_53]|uniref:glycerophosphodiester phosphodiesterase n=1 Tax=Dokdonia sp. Hel_I_53 TaxID=1566287 RepID=UPI00119AC521|nr:glycerophosphodiester phosphodiesterase [Dokdonia sp. Hel_I_53]TVZ51802.1 glycerophosphoryl diester phosphodiesterase [Dokdonia sp. Hel_I_53]